MNGSTVHLSQWTANVMRTKEVEGLHCGRNSLFVSLTHLKRTTTMTTTKKSKKKNTFSKGRQQIFWDCSLTYKFSTLTSFQEEEEEEKEEEDEFGPVASLGNLQIFDFNKFSRRRRRKRKRRFWACSLSCEYANFLEEEEQQQKKKKKTTKKRMLIGPAACLAKLKTERGTCVSPCFLPPAGWPLRFSSSVWLLIMHDVVVFLLFFFACGRFRYHHTGVSREVGYDVIRIVRAEHYLGVSICLSVF